MSKVAAWFKSELGGWGRAIRANPGAAWIRVGLIGLVVLEIVAVPTIVGDPLLDRNGLVHRTLLVVTVSGFLMPFARPIKLQFITLAILLGACVFVWASAYWISWSLGGSYANRIEAAKVTTLGFMYASLYATRLYKWKEESLKPE